MQSFFFFNFSSVCLWFIYFDNIRSQPYGISTVRNRAITGPLLSMLQQYSAPCTIIAATPASYMFSRIFLGPTSEILSNGLKSEISSSYQDHVKNKVNEAFEKLTKISTRTSTEEIT